MMIFFLISLPTSDKKCFFSPTAYYGRNSGGVTPTEENNLWIVGVAVGAIVLIIIVIWVIFCFIIKKRGPESAKEGEPAHLLRMKGGTKVKKIFKKPVRIKYSF